MFPKKSLNSCRRRQLSHLLLFERLRVGDDKLLGIDTFRLQNPQLSTRNSRLWVIWKERKWNWKLWSVWKMRINSIRMWASVSGGSTRSYFALSAIVHRCGISLFRFIVSLLTMLPRESNDGSGWMEVCFSVVCSTRSRLLLGDQQQQHQRTAQ